MESFISPEEKDADKYDTKINSKKIKIIVIKRDRETSVKHN